MSKYQSTNHPLKPTSTNKLYDPEINALKLYGSQINKKKKITKTKQNNEIVYVLKLIINTCRSVSVHLLLWAWMAVRNSRNSTTCSISLFKKRGYLNKTFLTSLIIYYVSESIAYTSPDFHILWSSNSKKI